MRILIIGSTSAHVPYAFDITIIPEKFSIRCHNPLNVGRNATGDSCHEGNTPTWGRWPWPVSARDACGRWPNRCHSSRKAEGPSTTGPSTQKGRQRASAEMQPRCGVTFGGVQRLVEGYACRERGRHPTDARKVVSNPRIAAGSTVVLYWLRLV